MNIDLSKTTFRLFHLASSLSVIVMFIMPYIIYSLLKLIIIVFFQTALYKKITVSPDIIAELIHKKQESLLTIKGKKPLPTISNSPANVYSLPPRPFLK